MREVLIQIAQVGILTFVIAGMGALGLALTMTEIVAPLKSSRLVVLVLVANFVVVPGLAVLAARALPMGDAAATAVILLGCCAGAPFLPTLARLSRGDPGLSVGVMVLLMVLTVGFAPFVVPLAVEGAEVSAWEIAQSLLVFMLVPLAAGLLVKGRYPAAANLVVGAISRASTSGLAIGIVAALLVTWREVFASVGSWIFLGTAIVIAVGLGAGWLSGLGRPDRDRFVLALGGAQRNISAALVIATSISSDVVVATLVAALLLPIALILLAADVGRRRRPSPAAR